MADESDLNRVPQPTPRQHRIASYLFGGFGLFFVLLSFFLTGAWSRWLFLILGTFSIVRAIWHAIISHRRRNS